MSSGHGFKRAPPPRPPPPTLSLAPPFHSAPPPPSSLRPPPTPPPPRAREVLHEIPRKLPTTARCPPGDPSPAARPPSRRLLRAGLDPPFPVPRRVFLVRLRCSRLGQRCPAPVIGSPRWLAVTGSREPGPAACDGARSACGSLGGAAPFVRHSRREPFSPFIPFCPNLPIVSLSCCNRAASC
ncbi:hypothetical protein GQ55_9G147200 [Panicum hallii var. hallii]|uniref:Uncharacterized protein n=1 Tax=Panicum hallii var. hallii TaxID=1504633 RepID=A0A2T7C367_9POAL|nr:hypothetical protein GQ55_9G147200 [Panicum hallii var. hallii]